MSPSLWRASLRHLGGHPWLTALSLLGVALGVAVVVSIDLANASAMRAFERSTESVTGRATHQLVGGPSGLAEALYPRLKRALGVREAAPVVEGFVRAAKDGRTLTVLGVDPLAERPFRAYAPRQGSLDLGRFLTEPGAVLMARVTAQALGLRLGDSFPVTADGIPHTLTLTGLLAVEPQDAQALDGLLLADLSTAQELFGEAGRLSRIDLRVPEGEEALLERLRSSLPPGAELLRSTARAGTVEQLTRAFRTNLTALSFLALVVGMFLIYNTMTFSVVQRHGVLGRMRALGVTRREVFTLVLSEAFALGVLGTLAGVLLGILLGRGLVVLVARTLNDLYFAVQVQGLEVSWPALLKGSALGLVATLAAAAAPAWEATHAPPLLTLRRSSSEDAIQRRAPRLALAGLASLASGVGLLSIPTRLLAPAYAGLFTVLVGASLLVPFVTRALALAAVPLLGSAFGLLGRLAARGVVSSLSRTAVALAALSVAVATTVGVGLMVASFRSTVVTWLELSLQADVFISPPSLVLRRGDATLEPEVVERLRTTPGAAASSTIRAVRVRVGGEETDLLAVDLREVRQRPYRFKEGDAATLWPRMESEDVVLVSEPYGFHRGVGLGDTLLVATDRGRRPFEVVGVYFDYGSDAGTVMMARATYERHFDDRGISGLALYAARGESVDALVDRVQRRAGSLQTLSVRANRTLRETSLEIFDRTFTITQVLRLLTVGVAFVGVLSALMALQLERARELAVLRATGLTPRQLWGLVLLQTGLLGLLAGLFAMPLGTALAFILVHVINQRSFGWTLQLALEPGLLAQAVLLAFLAALLAGLYPAWRMARTSPALALREE